MNFKNLILGFAISGILFSGCNDELSQVGPSIQPEGDRSFVYADTFHIEASTVKLDSVYARTTSGLLGQIYDPLYGNLKSDYICQFYCPEEYKFAHEPVDGKVDSMAFFIMYSNSGYLGDSLAPMQARVYKVTKPLDRNYYTNMDPKEYCDLQTLIGEKTYTAYDLSVPDSIRKITDPSHPNYYSPNIRIQIKKDIAQKFYDETVQNPGTFHNQESFNKFFPGFYVTTEYGTGSILEVLQSSFFIYYKYKTKSNKTGNDTIVGTREQFNVTKEVIQMNQISNDNLEQLLEPNDEYTYLKSPSGVCTKLVIPAAQINDKINGRILNGLNFKLKALPSEDWTYALQAPADVLLLPEDSVQSFFLNNKIEDYITAYRASYNSIDKTYSFGNISNILQMHLKDKVNEDLRMLVIPVMRGTQKSQGYGEVSYKTTSITNYMIPSGAKLKKDKKAMEIVVLTTKYND